MSVKSCRIFPTSVLHLHLEAEILEYPFEIERNVRQRPSPLSYYDSQLLVDRLRRLPIPNWNKILKSNNIFHCKLYILIAYRILICNKYLK